MLKIAFCHSMNAASTAVLIWDGKRWAPDDLGNSVVRAKDTIKSLYREAAETNDDDERARLRQWAARSESLERIRAMLSLAQTEGRVERVVIGVDCYPQRAASAGLVIIAACDGDQGQHHHQKAHRGRSHHTAERRPTKSTCIGLFSA